MRAASSSFVENGPARIRTAFVRVLQLSGGIGFSAQAEALELMQCSYIPRLAKVWEALKQGKIMMQTSSRGHQGASRVGQIALTLKLTRAFWYLTCCLQVPASAE